ncbi:MAG: hypothetical protein COY42_08980 [Armatimonadetes bacterium CG_4_10_14_0_8_um_filter_66_14]|nr:twin-arginine translocation signal domain-containing protein [Armatimonadota bacterium]PIU95259.1 MAG: hypothetical protein COS65_03450 [Armatimonadetes bacterium CG06_land_8_20_14_3_00_66_21]PIX45234.1 MAG: hypothetical protein COZ57_16040 [Armatimonadetes bacterium CG_4_8_14_3_um_filter_66_20]PIZ47257.1 MAG: hypothetical protein COY42_08980 [Armatimonadetes bacterium CG_4_10_14_0_8_um_filter_66_14]PJB74064.1 MAG: hypothetical protein CO096_04325 [Armatimonadetes bacterium CG_4_9_14_3_um_fi
MDEQSLSRRHFLKVSAVAGAAVALPSVGLAQTPFSGRLPKGRCRSVINADTLVVEGVGNIALLGTRGPVKDSPGYQKAVDAVVKYAAGKDVLLDQGPKPTQTGDGRFRAVVYYNEGGQWFNLNTKMLRAGLASAVNEPECHVDTADWVALVQEAKASKRGLYSMGLDLPETAEPIALAQARPGRVPGPAQPAADTGEPEWVPPYRRPYVRPEPETVQICYIGSITAKRFHRPTCLLVPRELDRVLFEGRLQALKNGYQPCLACRA